MDVARAVSRTAKSAAAVGAVMLATVLVAPAHASQSVAADDGPSQHMLTWGYSTWGQTGTGVPNDTLLTEPTLVATAPGIHLATISSSGDHALGVTVDGAVWAWGQNTYGALGQDPAALPESLVPVPVTSLPAGRYIEVAAGEDWSAALRDDGAVFAWGWGASGQLGNHTVTPEDQANPTPVRVEFPDGVLIQSIQAGALFGVAETPGGFIWTWGDNIYGQLGGGPSVPVIRDHPGQVVMPENVDSFAQVSVSSISVGAITLDGQLYGWGSNLDGNLAVGEFQGGSASPDEVDRPTLAHMPDGVDYEGVAIEDFVGFGFTEDGTIYVWGSNEAGLFADGGAAPDRTHPEPIDLPAGATPQLGCAALSCAVRTDEGAVYVWGDSQSGWFGTTAGPEIRLPEVVPYTQTHPVTGLQVDADNPFILAGADAPALVTESLRVASVGEHYSERIATGGTPLVATSILDGTLPVGVHFTDGTLEGEPTAAGEYRFTVRASSPAGVADRVYTLRVDDRAAAAAGHRGESTLAATGLTSSDALPTGGAALAVLLAGGTILLALAGRRRSPRRR
ncbi:RCC1 domain-containing protein [Cnuibacter sp. UC19_7]|uniref:RCC1 domain-containing protein n=1 Tax=Cnuibacter sp. UC19_7 TaxID=3350166 RepID=UPI00366E9FF2